MKTNLFIFIFLLISFNCISQNEVKNRDSTKINKIITLNASVIEVDERVNITEFPLSNEIITLEASVEKVKRKENYIYKNNNKNIKKVEIKATIVSEE